MSARKKKPKFPAFAHAEWEEEDAVEDGGYPSFTSGTAEEFAVNGKSKVVAVYKLVGFVTVEQAEPKPPQITVSKLRSKP